MSKIITVAFKPGGKIEVQTSGFTGASCTQASDAILRATGAKQEGLIYTDEFYKPEIADETQQQVQEG